MRAVGSVLNLPLRAGRERREMVVYELVGQLIKVLSFGRSRVVANQEVTRFLV